MLIDGCASKLKRPLSFASFHTGSDCEGDSGMKRIAFHNGRTSGAVAQSRVCSDNPRAFRSPF